MLKQKINSDFLEAFKAKEMNKKNFLGFIKSEIQNLEKTLVVTDLSDEYVIKILNKILKGIKETLSTKESDDIKFQLEIVESYLPKLMSEDDIQLEVKNLIESGATNIGAIMKAFSDKPVDKKLLSQIAQKQLN